MKAVITFFLVFAILFSTEMNSQEIGISKVILDESCDCINKIDPNLKKAKKNEEIKSCIESSIMADQMKGIFETLKTTIDTLKITSETDTIKDVKNFNILVDKDFSQIQKQLLTDCPALKKVLMENDKESEKSYSNKKKANEFYTQGQYYFNRQEWEMALVEFNKAVKKDPKFAFAWDNMGICYRKMNRFQQAVDCYKESLKIDPKGTVPLMNIAVAYDFLKEHKKAADIYLQFIKFYPEDPEGYYGAGRMFYNLGEYEPALENIFKAYFIYKETDSAYIHDAEDTIVIFYNGMKEKDKLEIFDRIAEKYNIKMQ